jgi:hypothetical protein
VLTEIRAVMDFSKFNTQRSLPTDFFEWLKRGDYQNFIRTVRLELPSFFPEVRVMAVGKQATVYIRSL